MNLTVMKNTNDITGLARNTFSALLICAMPAMASAQTYVTPVRSDITPPTPQSEAIMAVQAPQPDLLTGAVSLGVPLYTINVDGVECPLSLQYQTNGITVLSDPVPLGYGWSLMPALRITRTVLGRPDEKYPFSGDPQDYDEMNAMCYMCAVSPKAQSFTLKDRYDSEHDIVNICLPDKSLTRVMEATADTIVFSGACDSEYRVEADRNLNTITVTDPSGIRYYFGDIYEGIHDQTGYLVRTAWPLYKIETDTGREINLSWSFNRHPAGRRSWNGGYSFMDRINPSFMKSRENLDNDLGAQALLTPANETLDFLQLDGISFPGGNVTFGYKWAASTGGMLTSVKISSTDGVIKSYSLTYADSNCTLLTEVDGGEGNRYSFEYNTKYGTNPFSSLSRGRHSQDWWGYYNDKTNVSLTPKIQVKTYPFITNEDGPYKSEIGDADRSVDSTAMQALIMTKVTWPTGGTSSFEYEPHRFSPTKMETDGEIDPAYDLALSYGGGLRVRKITTSADDTGNDMVVRYEYPPARVRAVPSMASFIEAYNVEYLIPDGQDNSFCFMTELRMVNIMPMSDYMRYDTGVTPLWYDKVTTVWAEGKTETYFADILQDKDSGPEVGYGYRRPGHMAHVFDGAPVMTGQTVYRSENGAYVPVETTDYKYMAELGPRTIMNYPIIRNILSLEDNYSNAPDFVDGCELWNTSTGLKQDVQNVYSAGYYRIYPYRKRLLSKTHTVHTETGDISTTERYAYKAQTGLLEKVTTSTSEGTTSTVTVTYPDKSKGGTEAQMADANLSGVPLREEITVGQAKTEVSAQYAAIPGGAFRQSFTTVSYGNSTEAVRSPLCEYDRLGHIVRVTDADSIVTEWTWDSAGLYPVLKDQAGLQTAFAYKPLVGLSAVTTPFGAVTGYEYDGMNRLSRTSVQGLGEMQSVTYSLAKDANSIGTTTCFDDSRRISVTDHYDNLGRKTMTENGSTGISQHFRYDAMGRLYASSMPSADAPSSESDYAMTYYERSPRGVVVSTVKNGETWHRDGKTVRVRTLVNTATGSLSAPLYRIGPSGTAMHSGNYGAGQLLIEETVDENGHVSRTYTSKSGLVVMSEEGDGAGDMLRTRNIYDDYGRLRYVLPPSFADGDISTSDESFINNCYEFAYDACGRLSSRRFPGSTAPHLFVYSDAGRTVAEHTPSMTDNEWLVYFYDRHGRQAYTAKAGLLDVELEWHRQDFPVAEFTGTGPYRGYRLTPEPRTAVDNPLSAAYYDDYAFLEMDNASYMPAVSGSRPGLQTGAYDRNSGFSVTEYDEWGRVTATHRKTPKGVLTTRSILNRSGAPVQTSTVLAPSTGSQYAVTADYTYDGAGRVSRWDVAFGGASAGCGNTYGKNGQISAETFGNNVKRKYTYDCHGWVGNIETIIPEMGIIRPILKPSAPVSEEFYTQAYGTVGPDIDPIEIELNGTRYNETILYADGANPRYDGTASAHVSTLGGRYDYTFDCHDRLVRADYQETDDKDLVNPEDFSTEYTYNEVGAPLSVRRYGQNGVTKNGDLEIKKYGLMDDLSYVWDGMMLSSVTAQGAGTEFYGRTGYPLSAAGGVAQYAWNKAGMLYSDSSRGIKKTTYNHMGQPSTVEFTDGGELRYTYSAAGELLGVSTYALLAGKRRPVKVSERSYCGDFVFEGDSLAYVNFPGGYFDGNGGAHYRHPDFQGNITMVTGQDGKIEQHTAYYPYGEPWHEPAGQPYLYGGKERMRDGGLNDYDFSARRLNSALALWSTPDPLSLDYSPLNPYVYCAANPIRYVDQNGCEFTEGSKKYIENFISVINSLKEKNNAEILKHITELISGKGDATAIANRICTIIGNNNELKEILGEIDVLSKSSQMYNIFYDDKLNISTEIRSGTTFNKITKAIDITLGDETNYGLIAHELKHAYQFETGYISFGLESIPPLFYDKTDEKEAYRRGALFGETIPNPLPDLYKDYPDGPLSVSKLEPKVRNSPIYLQRYANCNFCTFRWKGKTYISNKL